MNIGIPEEVKVAEKRVAVTPSGVRTLVQNGHTVLFQIQTRGSAAVFPMSCISRQEQRSSYTQRTSGRMQT